MSKNDDSAAQQAWLETMKEVSRLISARHFEAALHAVNRFLPHATGNELRASVLGMRASLKEELGHLDGAKEDLSMANSVIGPGFAKYVNECAIAEIYRKQGKMPEVMSWYRMALRTSIDAGISGGAALNKFLRLHSGVELSGADQNLCHDVVRTSWTFLELRGKPNFRNLVEAASLIVQKEAGAQS
jgi:hypothetical protein